MFSVAGEAPMPVCGSPNFAVGAPGFELPNCDELATVLITF